MRYAGLFALIPMAAALSACDGLSPYAAIDRPPVVRTETAVAGGGSTISVRMINESRKKWEYGYCSDQVDRLVSGSWVPAMDYAERGCFLVSLPLPPGETRSYPVRLPEAAGRYRIRMEFLHFPRDRAETVSVTTNTFEVIAPPAP